VAVSANSVTRLRKWRTVSSNVTTPFPSASAFPYRHSIVPPSNSSEADSVARHEQTTATLGANTLVSFVCGAAVALSVHDGHVVGRHPPPHPGEPVEDARPGRRRADDEFGVDRLVQCPAVLIQPPFDVLHHPVVNADRLALLRGIVNGDAEEIEVAGRFRRVGGEGRADRTANTRSGRTAGDSVGDNNSIAPAYTT
jgi:hypothetical protein